MSNYEITQGDLDSKEGRDKIACFIVDMLEAGILQKGSQNERAKKNEEFYRNQPDKHGLKITEESEPIHLNLVQPRVDAIVTKVANPLLSNRPYYAGVSIGHDSSRNKECEDTVQFFFDQTDWQRKLRLATRIACLAAPAIFRVIYVPPGSSEQFGVLPGPHVDVIHPNDFVLFPLVMGGIPTARLVGHRRASGFRVQEILEKQKSGAFFEGDPQIGGGDDPQSWESGRDRTWSMTSEDVEGPDGNDRVVEVWEGLVKLDLNADGFQEWYTFTVARTEKVLLDMAPYGVQYEDGGEFVQYSRPWYFEHYVKPPMYGEFFCANSPAQDLQPIQGLFNDMASISIEGWKMTALPTIFQKGGALSQRVMKYGAGEIHEVPAGTEFEILKVNFDPSIMPFYVQLLLTLADSTVRISGSGLAAPQQSVKSDRATATEIQATTMSMDEGADEYRDNAALSGEEMADFIREIVYLHIWELSEHYDTSLPLSDPVNLAKPIRWEATGKTAASIPSVTIQQLQALLMLAPQLAAILQMDPTGMLTGLKPRGIIKGIIDKMDLPVPNEQLYGELPPGITDPSQIAGLLQQLGLSVPPGEGAGPGQGPPAGGGGGAGPQ